LENHVVEEWIETNWTIGKIKGKIRELFKINPYYILEFLYNGQILENSRQFSEIGYQGGYYNKSYGSSSFRNLGFLINFNKSLHYLLG